MPEVVRSKIYRWALCFVIVLAVAVGLQLTLKLVEHSILASVPKVKLPTYTAEQLYSDPQARMIFLTPRVRGVSFIIYKVQAKDNLWLLAKKHGYSVHTIIGCNPQLKTYNVSTNQKILIPSKGGSLHPVQKGDTWEKIAEKYHAGLTDKDEDLTVSELQKTNYGVSKLVPGEYIFIPRRRPAVDLMNEEMQNAYALRDMFVSPLGGRISSAFGRRKHPVTGQMSVHGGIDIAVAQGTRVGAAAAGVVIVASYDVGHYGTAVFIDHQNGYVTHYGHLSKILVRLGQKVRQGQIIALSGSTGRVTGPHLHFTIKRNDVAIDPLRFLW